MKSARAILILIIVLAAALSHGAAAEATSPTADLYLRAQRLANLFFLEEAAHLYRQCIEADYEDFRYHLGLIDVYRGMDKVSELIPYYSQHVQSNEKDYSARLGMALCNYHQRNIEIARRYADDAKRLSPDNAYAYYCLALITRADAEKVRETEDYYSAVFRLAPDFGRAYTSYVYWQWATRHASRTRVLRTIEKALAAPKPDPMLYYWKNEVLKSDLTYDPREGIGILKEALAKDDSLVSVSIAVGELYADLGQTREEENTYREVIRKAPNLIEGYLHLGATLKKQHRYDEAIEVFERAREVPFQEVQKHWCEMRIFECVYYARRWDEAIQRLEEVIKRYPGSYITREAKGLLSALFSRNPSDNLVLVDGVPFLSQRGNWCGPAALSMVLGYWGLRETQEEIAQEIYTGIAGTAPQIIGDYCRARGFVVRTFEGSPRGGASSLERWKQLLDQRVPFLWLSMLRRGGGHYVVVTGYDDIRKEVIVHNPWRPEEAAISYQDLDDHWMLPSLRRTIVIVPEERAHTYDLSDLEPTFRLRLINFVFYVWTGSNLYRGIFPHILLNLGFISLFLAPLGLYLYFCIFPRGIGWIAKYALCNLVFVALCSGATYVFRSGFLVSLLLGYHISVVTLLLIAPVGWLFSLVVQDYFTRREFLGLAVITFAVFAIPAAVEKEGWGTYLPIAFLIGAVVVVFRQRFQLIRATAWLRRGRYAPAATACERLGRSRLDRDPFYAALFIELQARVELCHFDAALDLINILVQRRPLTAYRKRLLELCRVEVRLLRETRPSVSVPDKVGGRRGEDAAHAGDNSELPAGGDALFREYVRCVAGYAAVLRGDCARAVELAEAARAGMSERGFGRAVERLVEFLRCQRSLQAHFALLNVATLVTAYRCLGAREKAEGIVREHPEIDDFSFRLKGRIVRGE